MEQHHLGGSGSHSVRGILEANTGIVLRTMKFHNGSKVLGALPILGFFIILGVVPLSITMAMAISL